MMGEKLFWFCLKAYPRAFRDEYGPAMAETFPGRLQDLRTRSGWRISFLLRECSSAAFWGTGLRIAYTFGLRGRGKTGAGAGTARIGRLAGERRSWMGRGRDFFPNLRRDLRHTIRSLARKPGVTLNAILALSLGIGLSTVIFSFIYGVMYRPLPVPEGERIMHLEQADPVRGRQNLRVSLHDFLDWKAQQTSFDDLAAVGLYGVTSFSAGQRTRELGVRIALGAKGGDVLRLVVRQGTIQVLVGLAVGVLLGGLLMTFLASQGADTVPWNPGVTFVVCCVLGGTGLVAVFTPAWRTTKVDPVEALRNE